MEVRSKSKNKTRSKKQAHILEEVRVQTGKSRNKVFHSFFKIYH